MGRWERSKQLASASWGVVARDKELMILPLLSGLASMAIASTFLIPVFITGRHTDLYGETTFSPGVGQWILLAVMYVALAYCAIFYKTAPIGAAAERLRGGDPTLTSALAGAGRNAGRILPWAIVSTTVSMILRSLEDRAGIIGRIAIGLVGVAWAAVTFLVLPILVFEQVGVGEAIKRSGAMLRRTWGENLLVNFGIGLLAFALSVPAFLGIAAGAATGTALGLGTMVALAVLWLIGVSCWAAATTGVFQVALYRYAVDGVAPAGFDRIDFAGAFRTKGQPR